MQMPKISVIMPVYNTKEEYLREAIESILNQTFSDFELLIVDNGSEKGYVSKILSSYEDMRIKPYRIDVNVGPAEGRNYALAKATGEYIALMDSDDVSYPTRFEKQIAYFRDHPEIGCLGGRADVIGDDKDKINFPCVSGHEAIEAFLIFEGCAFCQSTVMVKKSIIDKYNIHYKSQYVPAEDYAFWLDLVGKTKFENLEEKLLSYRFHHENISHKQSTKQMESAHSAQIEAIKKYCGLEELDEKILSHFYEGKILLPKELEILYEQLIQIMQKLKEKNLSNYSKNFKKRFKKQYYKNHSLKGQLALFKSPLNQEFNISLSFRLFCLISRGVL